MKSADRVNGNRDFGSEIKSLRNENSQRDHRVKTRSAHEVSRTETINCPLRSYEHCLFKNNTQSYSYSSEDEFERVERKEKERYERRLIREHLKQKSRDKIV